MQQFMEFAGNHPILVGGFVAVLLTLVVTEVMRRTQGFKLLGPGEAVSFINRDDTKVIDVSPAADFNKGHIISAVNVPMSRIKDPDPDPELQKLVTSPLLVTCKTGQTAGAAAAALVKLGAPEVAVLRGGMMQWKNDNFPVTKG
ncbi:MAG: rhodanese-like domain-containing protein [Pseudomonadota bacterium]